MDRPEDVHVGCGDDDGDSGTDEQRSARCAERHGPQRHPDGHEPISADDDDQPGAEMDCDDDQEHESAAGGRRRVQPLHTGDESQPRLERADVENHRVDDGQHQ